MHIAFITDSFLLGDALSFYIRSVRPEWTLDVYSDFEYQGNYDVVIIDLEASVSRGKNIDLIKDQSHTICTFGRSDKYRYWFEDIVVQYHFDQDASAQHFISMLEKISGQKSVEIEIDVLRESPDFSALTPREILVLEHLQIGATNKDIARDLSIEIVTVKLHVRSICKKLDVSNRTQAALLAQKWLS